MHDSLPIHPFIYPIRFVKSVRLPQCLDRESRPRRRWLPLQQTHITFSSGSDHSSQPSWHRTSIALPPVAAATCLNSSGDVAKPVLPLANLNVTLTVVNSPHQLLLGVQLALRADFLALSNPRQRSACTGVPCDSSGAACGFIC